MVELGVHSKKPEALFVSHRFHIYSHSPNLKNLYVDQFFHILGPRPLCLIRQKGRSTGAKTRGKGNSMELELCQLFL